MTYELPYSGEKYDIGSYDPEDLSLDTADGSIASFSDGADNYPIKSLKVSLEPKQSGTGDPSPSNVRPISGWDEVIISQTPYPQTTKPHAITGKNIFQGNTYHRPTPCHIEIGQTFTASASGQCGIRWYDANMNQLDHWTSLPNTTADGRKYRTYTMNTGCEYFEFYGSGDVTDFMVEIGSTPSPYEPYGQSYTITLPSTVYGGEVDVVSGLLKSYPFYPSYNGETLSGEWICDRAVYSQGTTPPIGSQVVDMSGNGTEYQLEPTEIKTLKGNNNIWADTGGIKVEYIPAVEKNILPYSREKYNVGVFEPIDEDSVNLDSPLTITPIDEPISITPIDVPIALTETEENDDGIY